MIPNLSFRSAEGITLNNACVQITALKFRKLKTEEEFVEIKLNGEQYEKEDNAVGEKDESLKFIFNAQVFADQSRRFLPMPLRDIDGDFDFEFDLEGDIQNFYERLQGSTEIDRYVKTCERWIQTVLVQKLNNNR